ncbi:MULTISPECIES: hypothetical protein [unclassified Streptomyces]|uniref:hypothetical protein n=1 Tax=unclassified Streptomyces TaxID=2593676 RepID=UPI000AC1FAE6|nr:MULTISPECIES: hypothetical protein [unclassified Streptomyces]
MSDDPVRSASDPDEFRTPPTAPPAPPAENRSWFPRREGTPKPASTRGPETIASSPPSAPPPPPPVGTVAWRSAPVPPEVVLPSPTAPVAIQQADVVAHTVSNLHIEKRTRDVLDGARLDRDDIRRQPFVRDDEWNDVWDKMVDPATSRPNQRALLIVAPGSYGSTTFALQLLARHTGPHIGLVKLDADWTAPRVGRLPLAERVAFQLDLKDPDRDRPSADFVSALDRHAQDLEACDSYLVITVAEELYDHMPSLPGPHVQVVRLHAPPPARQVVEAHLRARDCAGLIPYLDALDPARVSLGGLDAVEAVRAAGAVVTAWQEYERVTRTAVAVSDPHTVASDSELAGRITDALSDWRDKLDGLFGERATVHAGKDASLTFDDRCLLLSLAARQSSPLPDIAQSARALQETIASTDSGRTALGSGAQAVFAGRGLRRRVIDVGGSVDSHDAVVFDRPGYGKAVLTYVWDNYEVMRRPLLQWLVKDGGASAAAYSVDAVSALVLRQGGTEHLGLLGSVARGAKSDLLPAVMLRAVRDEHIGRRAWGTLYRWAGTQEFAGSVVAICRRVLNDREATASMAKMAMVRLRRVVHASPAEDIGNAVLEVFTELSGQPGGVERLAEEVQAWQDAKASSRAGGLAFLALMSIPQKPLPRLMTDGENLGIDVDRALRDLLGDVSTAPDVIPRLSSWIAASVSDPSAYDEVVARLVPVLRGHRMFQASMDLMQALKEVRTTDGENAGADFYRQLVDKRFRPLISIGESEDPA